jgi:RNA polymerase sigma factor (TIGR02999 family)
MRRILIDRARRKKRLRHGGDLQRVPLSDVEPAGELPTEDLLEMDQALERFSAVEPVKAELVKLRYFAGLSEADAAAALRISRATASRYWNYARAWLIHELEGNSE